MVRVTARHDCTLVLVGDHRVGKTALAHKFRTGKFESGYQRTGFETLATSCAVGSRRVKFTIYDTAGSRGPNTHREIAYREADVLILCYKISDPNTLFGALNHWVPELRAHAPATPILLVGCQTDLRGDRAVLAALAKQDRSPVSSDQARSFSQQIGAVAYVETSAKISAKGPESVFELAAQISLEQVTAAEVSVPPFPRPISTSTPEHTLDREYSTDSAESFWEQYQSPSLPPRASSLYQRSLAASLSSSLNSTRSTLSIPRSPPPAVRSRRNSMSLRARSHKTASMAIGGNGEPKMIRIKCQRLTEDKIYEEVEIEVPAPVYETMQACNTEPSNNKDKRKKESLGSKLKNLFIRD
jgi:small GTP-binding protein